MKLASRNNRIGASSDDYDSTARDSPPPSRQVGNSNQQYWWLDEMILLYRDHLQGRQYTKLLPGNKDGE